MYTKRRYTKCTTSVVLGRYIIILWYYIIITSVGAYNNIYILYLVAVSRSAWQLLYFYRCVFYLQTAVKKKEQLITIPGSVGDWK